MNRMLKKILALVMTITLLMGVIPAEALAAVNSVTSKTVSPFAASIQAVKPEEKVATYTFLVDGIVQEAWTQSKTAGETVELPGAPEGNGEFLGWYRDNEKVTSLVATEADLGKTIELTAKFSEFRYVEFMSRDGSVVVYAAKADGDANKVSSEVLETAASLVSGLDGEESVAGWSREPEGEAETVTFGDGTVRYYPVIERGYWVTFDSDGGTYFAPQFAKPNTTVALPDVNQVSKPGYTFAGWELNGNKVTEVDGTAEVKATWTPNADTRYTVIHWYENADDGGYTFHKSETKTGTTGESTQAQALTEKTSGKNIRGEDVSDNVFQARDFKQETISGDGSTIVNIYYTRKLYTITFDGSSSRVLICGEQEHTHNWWCRRHDCTKEEHSHNSSCYKTEVSAYASITKKYGATISQSEWPKDRNGNANWSLENGRYIAFQSTMPMRDSSLKSTGDWGNENTATYYVEAISRYQDGAFDKNGRWFVEHHKDVTIGTGSYTVGKEDRYAIDGFTPIPEMGTQVGNKYANAKFYYSRNSYNVVYMNNGAKANEQEYKFEADISDAGNYTPERPSGVNPDYVFYGWYKDPDGTQEMDFTGMTMPAGNLVVYAKWAPKKANAQVHLKVSLSGTPVSFEVEYGKKLKDISNAEYASYEELVAAVRNANLDANGKPVSGKLVWYRVDENGNKISRFNENTEIRGDIILAPFFPDDTLSYAVTYTGAGSTADSSRYQSGSTAYLLKPAGTASLTFQGWKVTQGPDDILGKVLEPGTGVKMTEDVVLEAQYTKAPDKLTLTYHSELSGAAEGSHTLEKEFKDIRANATVTVKSLEELEFMEEDQIPGYQFMGWATEEGGKAKFQPGEQVTITADGSNDLWAVWQRKVKPQKLYVYTKVTGDTTGLVLNKDGWYTLGYVELDLPDPDGYDFGVHEHDPYLAAAIAAAKGDSMNRYEKNTSIAMDKVEFPDDSENEYGLRVAKGATSYEDDGLAKTWHLNGKIDVQYLGTVVYHYINTADDAEMETSSGDVYTVGTALTFSKDSAKGFNNMHCVGVSLTNDKTSASDNVSYTVEHKNQDVYYFYAPDEAAYTVRFMEKDTENSLRADDNGTAAYGAIFTPDELKQEIPGFHYDSADKEELTIGANSTDNVITLYYVKNSYKVIYKVDGEVVGEEETYDYNTNVTVRPGLTKDGYTFSGWTTEDAEVTGGSFTMPSNNVTFVGTWTVRSDLSYTVHYYWNGTTTSVAEDKTVDKQTFDATVTESPITVDGYTAVSNDSKSITISTDASKNVITFYYYKNVTLTAKSDTKPYNGEEQSVSGFTGAPQDANFDSITVGAKGTDVGSYPANFEDGTVGKVDATEKYIVAKAVNGELTITPTTDKVTVTITERGGTETYDGSEKTVTGYDVLIDNEKYTESDFTFSGDATVKGTDAGTYNMELKAEDFVNNNKNFDNVEFVIVDGALTINPVQIKLTANTASKTYDGNALTDSGYEITSGEFVKNEGLESVTVSGSQTEVGSSDNVITSYKLKRGTIAGNYQITTEKGTLTVNPVSEEIVVTIKGHTAAVSYNGTEQSISGYDVISISNSLYTDKDFTFSGSAEAKGTNASGTAYPMGLTAANFTNANTKTFTNVRFVVEDGGLTINPAQIKLTAKSANKVYDGKPLQESRYDVTGTFYNGDDDNVNVTVTGSQTIPGSSANTLTYTWNEGANGQNYTITTENGKLTVTNRTEKFEITVKANSKTVTYDGKVHTVSGLESSEFTVDDVTFKVECLTAEKSGTDVKDSGAVKIEGTAKVLDADGNDVTAQFKVIKENGSLEIQKRDFTITANPAEKIYGEPDPTFTGTVTGLANEADLQSVQYLRASNEQNVGKYENEIVPFYKLKDSVKDNYNEPTITPADFTIKPLGESGWSVNVPSDVPYDGTEHQWIPTVTAGENTLTDGVDYDVAYDTTDFVDVKTITVTVTAKGNYTGTATRTYRITPVELTVNTFGDSRTYDGQPLTAGGEVKGLVNGETATVETTGTQTDVGKSDNGFGSVIWGTAKEGNYTVKPGTIGELEVTPKELVVTTKGDTKTYDGQPLTADGKVEGLVDGETVTFQVTGSQTNKGSSENTYTLTWDGTAKEDNYTVTENIGTLTVDAKEIHIVTDGDSKVYDGQPLTAGGRVEGLVSGEIATVTTTGSQTEVGSSSNTYGDIAWGDTDPNNYVHNTGKDELGTLTVTPKSIDEIPNVEKQDVEVNTPVDHLYDGEIHQWVPTVTDQRETQRVLVQDRDYTVSYDTENFVDVKTVTVTIRGIGNYTGQVVRTYKITPRPVTVIAASNTWEYDGNDHTESGWLVAPSDAVSGLVKTDAIADVTVTGSQRIVGSSANVASDAVFAEGTLAGNYTVSYQDGTLEVTGRAVRYNLDVQPNGGNFLYDGTEHTVSGYTFQAEGATFASKLTTFFAVRSGGEGDSFTLGGNTFTLSGIAVAESRTNAGQTIVRVTGTPVVTDDRGNDVTDQFSVTLKTAELNVARRDVLLGSVSDAKRFDNTPLTNDGTYVGGENGFAPGEGATFQVTGSQTAVGFSTNWFTYTLNDNTLAENYDIRLAYGTLTVTQVPVYTLTVHYVDENGAQLAPDYVGGFEAGAQYLVYSPAVEGYKPEFDFVRSAAQGMPAANVELTVVYTQDDQPAPEGEIETTAPGGEIEPTEDGGYDITPITEDDVPLAGGGEHKDDIVHFLLMAAALVVQILFADKRKKTQKEIFELKQKLGDTSMDDDN